MSNKIVACHDRPVAEIIEAVQDADPLLVGFSLIFQRMLLQFRDLIAQVRHHGVSAHLTIGGHYPSIAPKEILNAIPALDSVVRHEGEDTMLDLFHHLAKRDDITTLPGIAVRNRGEIKVNPPRKLITDLDRLPFPVRSTTQTFRGLGIAPILASRGCHYDCSFCSIRQFYGDAVGPLRRTRSPENVVEEMARLFEDGVRIFRFNDDDLGMKTKVQQRWLYAFADALTDQGLADDILWRISVRVDELDEGVLRRLQEVGLAYLYLGIESGSEQGLLTCNKHYSVSQVDQSIALIDRLGLSFEYGFMLFDPYSSLPAMRESLELLKRMGVGGRTVIHFTKMLPYAGTPIAACLAAEGRLLGAAEDPDYDFLDPRIDIFLAVVMRAMSATLFEGGGLVETLQLAKFDASVLKHFFADKIDADGYGAKIDRIVDEYNHGVTETFLHLIDFMEPRTFGEILVHRELLGRVADELRDEQTAIWQELAAVGPCPR